MVLTLVVANCAHILITVLYGLRRGVSNEDSLLESLSINFQPVLLASTTTALGFLSMNFSEVPPFNHLGNIVAVGVLASLVLSMLLLPALVVISPDERNESFLPIVGAQWRHLPGW